ncbi:tetratricopeptide repeat protein [Ureibacillus manganicus]|uniref:Tetratrico peptide repeat group 5 domain-containing protein n=1 Tax=Ureibacillus manganicus DSM 26584 TaxID=1384049 RepID=A0A0A3HXG8_9BACL|nr:tetratricopeptide repeat protein [Ureibacillus manganicus]KGR77271.1 hypothetical protein CD29_15530 [Ureibacillus manganicus DSM 26584]
MENELKEALELRRRGSHKESNEVLIKLVEQYPNNASINYQCAWSYDLMGEEVIAVPYYEDAIRLGLPKEELEGAFLGLGSTYRTLGEYEKSKKVLQQGIEKFPNNGALQVFYSMTLYNLNEHSQAMEILIKTLLETTKDQYILNYKRAIEFYSDKLDEVWK